MRNIEQTTGVTVVERPRTSPASGGFTLIELLITIAILGIILAVAIPNYRQWVLESGRAEAKAVLMDGAQRLERCFTRLSAYNDPNCNISQGDPELSLNGKYELTVTRVTETEFDLTAAPQGGQTEDTECGTYTLSHTGQRGAAGSTDPAVVAKCW